MVSLDPSDDFDIVFGLLADVCWRAHGQNTGLLVDVGGGVGHVALSLARSYPNLRIVLQDRAEVIAQAVAVGRDILFPSSGRAVFTNPD